MKKPIFFALLLAVLAGCSGAGQIEWYESEMDAPADVFYICSTDVLSAGDGVYTARLTEVDKFGLRQEMDYAKSLFGPEFNFYSPYYHQFTLDAAGLAKADFDAVWEDVTSELAEDFDYYLKHFNRGRPFILAGFSQGAMGVLELLKTMDDEVYSRLVAAYLIGYRLSAEDLEHPHIVAAQDAASRGVTVSFNSVASPDAVWPLVSEGAATCINPLNWTTDSTPAPLFYDGDSATVSVDPGTWTLVVSGLNSAKYRFPILEKFAPSGNLHHWDCLFYASAIHDNALLRAYGGEDPGSEFLPLGEVYHFCLHKYHRLKNIQRYNKVSPIILKYVQIYNLPIYMLMFIHCHPMPKEQKYTLDLSNL